MNINLFVNTMEKSHQLTYNTVTNCIVCDLHDVQSYGDVNMLFCDFRGGSTGVYKVVGDVADLAELSIDGVLLFDDSGNNYAMKAIENNSECLYSLSKNVDYAGDSKYSSYKVYKAENWSLPYSMYIVRYDNIIFVSKTYKHTLDVHTRYFLRKDVTLSAMAAILGIDFSVYIKRLCTVNRGTPQYGYIVNNLFQARTWSNDVRVVSTKILDLMGRGVKIDFLYGGSNAPSYYDVVPKGTINSLVDDSAYVKYVVQMDIVSQKVTYEKVACDELKQLAWNRYISGKVEDKDIQLVDLIKKYDLDIDGINQIVEDFNRRAHEIDESVIKDEDILLGEVDDTTLILGKTESDDGAYEKQGYSMIDMYPLFSPNYSSQMLDMPIDIIEDVELNYNYITDDKDSINTSQQILGRIQYLDLLLKDNDVLIFNAKPIYSIVYDINQTDENFGSIYDLVERQINIYHSDRSFAVLGGDYWKKVDKGYLFHYTFESSEERKRVRVRTVFERKDPRKNCVNVRTNEFPYPYVYRYMMCRYMIGYCVEGLPLLNLNHYLSSDRLRVNKSFRDVYGKGDTLYSPDVCGYTFPLEYKGPLFDFVLKVRRILFANEILWLVREVDEPLMRDMARHLHLVIPQTFIQRKT
jgi:hypothetical protein